MSVSGSSRHCYNVYFSISIWGHWNGSEKRHKTASQLKVIPTKIKESPWEVQSELRDVTYTVHRVVAECSCKLHLQMIWFPGQDDATLYNTNMDGSILGESLPLDCKGTSSSTDNFVATT